MDTAHRHTVALSLEVDQVQCASGIVSLQVGEHFLGTCQFLPLAQVLSTSRKHFTVSDEKGDEKVLVGASCAICIQDLSWTADFAAHLPIETWSDRPPEGRHFMHEQCLEKNMVQYDKWECSCCRECLKSSGYTRITKTQRVAILSKFVRNEFWRLLPSTSAATSDANDEGILEAALQGSEGDAGQVDIALTSTVHSFRFWDNVMVACTEPNLEV